MPEPGTADTWDLTPLLGLEPEEICDPVPEPGATATPVRIWESLIS